MKYEATTSSEIAEVRAAKTSNPKNMTDTTAERVPLAEAMRFDFDLTRFIPVVLTTDEAGIRRAVPRMINTSGDFTSLAGTDGIIELSREADAFPAGYAAPFFAW